MQLFFTMLHHSYTFDRTKKERDVTCERRFKISTSKTARRKEKETSNL